MTSRIRCIGSKDLLTLMGVTSLPPGVRRSRDRHSAYVIDHTSSINAPVSKVVPVFPAEFALLITARQHTADSGFLFTVNDMLGFVTFSSWCPAPGLRLGWLGGVVVRASGS